MNFQKPNGFNLRSNAALLTILLSFPALALAAQAERDHSPSEHSHHHTHGNTMSEMMASPASMQNAPMIDSKEHTAHTEAAGNLASPNKDQITVGLRSPDYSDGYQNTASHHMMSSPNLWSVDAEKLELAHDDLAQQNSGQYELKFWYGNDYNRLYLNTSGEFAQNDLEQASTSLMWWRPFSPYWNSTFGLKQDYVAENTDQTWLGFGISGLAPYWFDVEASVYGALTGQSQLQLNASYDLNISQKWVLQPEVELLAYGKTDVQHRYGAGLAEIKSGLRLRYEITPQFAPYIGLEHERFVGKTAKLYKDLEDDRSSRKILLGLRFWY